tara:strand:- start:239 stop:586 length:348 start_codon:yes stop_codon:yes gene_type:complete
MFLTEGAATAFMERTGGPAPNEGTLFFMGSVGYIYLGIAIANVMAMMAPASQSMVYFRAMVIITFIAALRAIGNAIIADEILTYAPLIATILVYVGYAVVMSRNKARLGTHFGWL